MTWQHSEQVDEVVPAFVAALGELANIHKTNKADMGSHSYTYADLGTVLEAIKPVLTERGLAVSQPVGVEGVATIVFHTSGQWLAFGPLKVKPTQNTPQAEGSAITYARRYQILAALNLATEDDDGARASAHPTAHPNAARVDQLQADWNGKLTAEQQAAGKAWATEHGHTVTPPALFKDEGWLEQVEAWVDEQLQAPS